MQEFIVTIEQKNTRLDKFLVEKLPGYSRSQIQKMIKSGLILVNAKQVTPHHFLKESDTVMVGKKKAGGENPKIEKPKIKLDIVFENEDLLVINKPVGIIVHPTETIKNGTLIDALLKHCPDIKNVSNNPERPGIVHRLDKDVSGLMVIAKTQLAFECLKRQFKNRQIKKEYLALVHGQVTKPEGIIETPIGRSERGAKMATRPSILEKDKEAITEYEVAEKFQHYTLLKVRTKTGRTHQIRVHLNSIGHPIVGDEIYHPKKMKVKDLGRLFLYASRLEFLDLSKQLQKFELDFPQNLKIFLENLK